MTHTPIQLEHLGFSFSHKLCFQDFSERVFYGQRIAIIGRNGSGKTSLLKILQGLLVPTEGNIIVADDVRMGYVPQVISDFEALSGGQRFQKMLTQALACDPNVLLLDEPTNHLDVQHRKTLLRMLRAYSGTLIVVSHDVELLRSVVDTIWHIDQGQILVFFGRYDDYQHELSVRRQALQQELSILDRQKKDMHQRLMQEQVRASKSAARGEKHIRQRKWPTVVSAAKAGRSNETSGRKLSALAEHKQEVLDRLSKVQMPELILPKFSLHAAENGGQTLVSIVDGAVAYDAQPILQHVHLSLMGGERVAIRGANGSGKSTLVRAILGDALLRRTGEWYVPRRDEIGYLDQHYRHLDADKTVLESIADVVPTWSYQDVRRHLNDFLFRKNEEVQTLVANLSGGERVRLSLAQIAARTPQLLILDEVTNNLDLETRAHVIEVLRDYPGALMVISHDEDFLSAIGVREFFDI